MKLAPLSRLLGLALSLRLLQLLHAATPVAGAPVTYAMQRETAEAFIAEKSFAKANEIYRAVNVTNLPSAEQRWVLFRRADTVWRSEASTQCRTPLRRPRRAGPNRPLPHPRSPLH